MSNDQPNRDEVPIHLRRRADEIRQCGCPRGELGQQVAESMNEFHAKLWQWGLEHIDLPTGEDAAVLDIGCASGMLIKTLAEQTDTGRLCGVDHSEDMIAMAREKCAELCRTGRAEFFAESVSKLPFDDESFDLITAMETIYFWPDIENDLVEVHRVMRTGGTFLAVVESYDDPAFAERNDYCMELSGGKVFKPMDVYAFLQKAGFQEIEVDTIEEKNWMTVVGKR